VLQHETKRCIQERRLNMPEEENPEGEEGRQPDLVQQQLNLGGTNEGQDREHDRLRYYQDLRRLQDLENQMYRESQGGGAGGENLQQQAPNPQNFEMP